MNLLVFDTCLDKMYVTLACDNSTPCPQGAREKNQLERQSSVILSDSEGFPTDEKGKFISRITDFRVRGEIKILSSKIVENKDNKYHSAFLISTIKEILKENNLTPQDLNAIGINIGPGSFTGIRACTTVARVMAQQLNIPAAGVSSLEILSHIAPVGEKSAVALDARKNMAYFYIDGEIKGAVQLEKVSEILRNNDYYLITDDKLQPRLGGISYQRKEYPLGDILAQLAFNKLKAGSCKWQELKPLYIQPPPMG